MRNWTIGLIAAMALAPVGAHAFNAGTNADGAASLSPTCSVQLYANLGAATAYVAVEADETFYFAGGSRFASGQLLTGLSGVTADTIASCLGGGLTAADVKLVQEGPMGRLVLMT